MIHDAQRYKYKISVESNQNNLSQKEREGIHFPQKRKVIKLTFEFLESEGLIQFKILQYVIRDCALVVAETKRKLHADLKTRVNDGFAYRI